VASIDEHTRPEVVIASSSSGLPPSQFITQCKKARGRVLVGHPFNPPHLIPLVEVVPHPDTDQSVITAAMGFYTSLGMRPIQLYKEIPGFVANRLQAAINNEAYALISRGIVSAEDLDAAVSCGPGLRWALTGPIAINALGGGGGPDGFNQRLERLGPSIRAWEQDILRNRFAWRDEDVAKLRDEVNKSYGGTDWNMLVKERDSMLIELLAAKAKVHFLHRV
jgi:3-hydroxyacyl-CoA dehydrogenase